MHNNIMAAGSKDRPPMLATGRYAQWRSRFLRYIDTKTNGDALRKCILEGPYKPTTIVVPAVAATDDSPTVPQHTTVETILNMSEENKAHFKGSNLLAIAIERLQQGESLNIQDVKTNLFWELESLLLEIENQWSHITLQLQPEWSRFVTIVTQTEELDTVSYHKLFDILKQYQKEVNEIHAERIAKSANLLTLVAAAQPYPDNYYQAPKQSFSTRSNASTRHKGKEIAKPVTPPSESGSDEDSDPEQAQKDKEMQKNLALITKYFKKLYKPTNNNLRTSLNSKNKTVDTSPRYTNDNQFGQFKNQRTMTVAGARETVGSQEAKAEQANLLADTNEEIDEHEFEAHYSFMTKIQEVLPADSDIHTEPSNMCNNDNQVD
ncbi:hypothetical protein Tco_0471447 [Tanacetum coccineum]